MGQHAHVRAQKATFLALHLHRAATSHLCLRLLFLRSSPFYLQLNRVLNACEDGRPPHLAKIDPLKPAEHLWISEVSFTIPEPQRVNADQTWWHLSPITETNFQDLNCRPCIYDSRTNWGVSRNNASWSTLETPVKWESMCSALNL